MYEVWNKFVTFHNFLCYKILERDKHDVVHFADQQLTKHFVFRTTSILPIIFFQDHVINFYVKKTESNFLRQKVQIKKGYF